MVVEEGTDLHFLQEGFVSIPICLFNKLIPTTLSILVGKHSFELQITVTPIGALSQVDVDCQNYYKEWLPKITNQP